MKHMAKFALALLMLPVLAWPVESEREIFQQAWARAGRGDIAALDAAIARIPDYGLTPYLRYERIRQRPLEITGPEMERFLARYRDWSFADGLQQRWLNAIARAGRDDELLRYGEPARAAATRCLLERARLERGQTDGLIERVAELWLSPVSQPTACDPLFAWWRRAGHPDGDTAWRRFSLAMDAGETRLARYLRRYLTPADRRLAEVWLTMASRLTATLSDLDALPDRPKTRQMLAWGLNRLAPGDWRRTQILIERFSRRYSFPDEQLGPIRRRAALFQAVDLDPGAIQAIDTLDPRWADQQMLEWRLRVALAEADWEQALASIQRMSTAQQGRERWRYWRARALQALDRSEADPAFEALAGKADYYGFLAALRHAQPLTLCPTELHADGAIQRRLMADAEFERALELYRVGLNFHARWTFQRVDRRLRDAERQQAALLVAALGWHDRAIASLSRSGALTAYAWRFPIIERERVVAIARARGLNPALVFGMMRAESAMQADARSPAGARGLLQLMPGTAQGVARRTGLRYEGAADLYRPERNIALGIAHLHELAQRFDGDWTLVAAAYNAGIGNARRWQRERPDLPRDIWIETLSFHETRDYIPRVLAFATIYEWQLDQPASVLARHVLGKQQPAAFECR